MLTSTTAHLNSKFQNLISHLHQLYRLLQNRKSAKKCRLKKKAEFHVLAGEVDELKKNNKDLQEKVSALVWLERRDKIFPDIKGRFWLRIALARSHFKSNWRYINVRLWMLTLSLFWHNQINEITLMLYQKIDENNALQRKLDQLNAQNQQLVFQQQLAATLQQQQQPQ